MIHLYTTRHFRNDTVKLLCSKANVVGTQDSVTTVPDNVTCPKCLEILIPKFESKLAKMRANWKIHGLMK